MIGLIETAIIARLKSASDGGWLGYRYKKVEAYLGQFQEQDLKNVLPLLPGVFVVFLSEGAGQGEGWYGNTEKVPARFAVMVGATSLRNESASRHGAGDKVGTIQMVRDVQTLLVGQTLGLDIDHLRPAGVKHLRFEKNGDQTVSVLTAEFETAFVLGQCADPAAAALPPLPDAVKDLAGTIGPLPLDTEGNPLPVGPLAALAAATGDQLPADFLRIHADWLNPQPATTDTNVRAEE